MNDYALFLGHLSSQHTQSPPAKVPCENITSTKRILKHEHNAYYTTAIGASIDAPRKKQIIKEISAEILHSNGFAVIGRPIFRSDFCRRMN